MNKNEFLKRLFAMYPNSFNSANEKYWLNAYDDKLPDNLDFDKLYDFMLDEWSGKTAPAPAWFVDKIPKCRKATSCEQLTKNLS